RFDAADPLLDLEALGGQEIGEPAAGLHLLVAQLGMVVDLVRERFQLVSQMVYRAGDRVLRRGHGVPPGRREVVVSRCEPITTERPPQRRGSHGGYGDSMQKK